MYKVKEAGCPDRRALIEGYEVSEQSCDGLDNDCDGRLDERLTDQAVKRVRQVDALCRSRALPYRSTHM